MSEVPDQTRGEWIATPERERREVESMRTIPDQTRDRWAELRKAALTQQQLRQQSMILGPESVLALLDERDQAVALLREAFACVHQPDPTPLSDAIRAFLFSDEEKPPLHRQWNDSAGGRGPGTFSEPMALSDEENP